MRNEQELRNLAIATEMYESVLIKRDASRVDEFISPNYIQHSALAADGVAPLKEFLETFARDYPRVNIEIRRSFVDGDFVIFHLFGQLDPDVPPAAIVDIFRLEDGMICEHWEVIQPIPDPMPHSNGFV